MARLIEWDITEGDYIQDHNHKIKGVLKLMAPPFHPIITLGI